MGRPDLKKESPLKKIENTFNEFQLQLKVEEARQQERRKILRELRNFDLKILRYLASKEESKELRIPLRTLCSTPHMQDLVIFEDYMTLEEFLLLGDPSLMVGGYQ